MQFLHLLISLHSLIPVADAGIKESQDAGRAIALGVPAVFGGVAVVGLTRTIRSWDKSDAVSVGPVAASP